LVYREGTTLVKTKTGGLGLGLGGGHIGAGLFSAKTGGTHQTVLSNELAPPQQKKVAGWVLATLLGLMMGINGFSTAPNTAVVFLVVTAGCGWIAFTRIQWNSGTFPELLSRWENSFLCQRCGNVFLIQADGSKRALPLSEGETPLIG
jgi:hypothetical protein